MKKFLFVLTAFLLVGQGCVGGAQNTSEDTGDASAAEMQVPAPGFEDVDEMIVEDDMDVEDEELMEVDDEMMEEGDEDSALAPLQIEMRSGNFFFEPNSINAQVGQEVEIIITENAGFHTFVIDELAFKETVIDGGTLTFTPTEAGEFEFYCDIGTHRDLGMFGTLIVTE